MHGRAVSEICGKQPVQYLQAAAPVEKQADPVAAYLKALPSLLASAGMPVSAAAAAMHGDWHIETLQGGWRLSKLICTLPECVYDWTVEGGNNEALRRAMGDADIDFELDGR